MGNGRDPLLLEIERALACSEFIPYGETQEFIDSVERIKKSVDDLVKKW